MKVSLQQIISFLQDKELAYTYYGNGTVEVSGFCSIFETKANSITWIKKMDSFDLRNVSVAEGLLIVADAVPEYDYQGYNLIITSHPKVVYFEILNKYFVIRSKSEICTSAIVESTSIGDNVSIGHHCYIGKDVVIGNNVIIKHNVVIESPVVIGNDCIIESGVVIGAPGNGYYDRDGIPNKVPDFCGVIIGNGVNIGANTCIERGTLIDTIIENNVKIGKLCYIAHNVCIGARCYVIGLSILAGSSKISEDVYVAPGAMVMNQISIGKNALVGMGAVVLKDVEANKVMAGVPAKVIRENKS